MRRASSVRYSIPINDEEEEEHEEEGGEEEPSGMLHGVEAEDGEEGPELSLCGSGREGSWCIKEDSDCWCSLTSEELRRTLVLEDTSTRFHPLPLRFNDTETSLLLLSSSAAPWDRESSKAASSSSGGDGVRPSLPFVFLGGGVA